MAVNSQFELMFMTIDTDTSRTVDHIDVELLSQNVETPVYITDVMFQSGTVATTWTGHVSEIRWSFDNA